MMPLPAVLRTIITVSIGLLFSLTAVQADKIGMSSTQPERNHPVITTPLPNVVRIIAFDRLGQSFGSGAYAGVYKEYGIIVTNRHVVVDAEGLVHVHFPNGFSSFGAVIKSDLKWDLALVAVSKPPESVPVLRISQRATQPGEDIWAAGFGDGHYRMAKGRCTRYLAPESPQGENPAPYEIMEVTVASRQGDSGGPILNARGDLAGVLFGSDMVQFTAGSYCGRVSQFLAGTKPEMERLPPRPETFFASVEIEGPRFGLQYSSTLTPALCSRTRGETVLHSPPTATTKGTANPVDKIRKNNIRQPLQPLQPLSQQQGITIPNQARVEETRHQAQNMPLPQLVQPALWAEQAEKVGSYYRSPNDGIVQTSLMSTSEPKNKKQKNKPRQYGMKLFADKDDVCFNAFFIAYLFFGTVLFSTAYLLLKKE
ncbi:hypothetical protein FACS189419_04660 [Planctomycetales bacterium]|nr:hypothetical protein FACS189419_04660 [Planctomycetales bacterium]